MHKHLLGMSSARILIESEGENIVPKEREHESRDA